MGQPLTSDVAFVGHGWMRFSAFSYIRADVLGKGMARARLHLICGNCGCNDMWTYHIDPSGHDHEGQLRPAVFLACGNCLTLHDLADTAIEQEAAAAN
ncbi:hypothetical protein ACWV27_26860 (plasmid) [Massilia varians]